MFLIAGASVSGLHNEWLHLLTSDADDVPKFMVFGVQLVVCNSSKPALPADGSPPLPPYNLELGLRDFVYGPPAAASSHITLWHFMSRIEVVKFFYKLS